MRLTENRINRLKKESELTFPRSSGILLHPTSLPGRFGIGDLGYEARIFLDFLAGSGQSLWQVMPLGPTGFGDSPYACFSAFAGNPFLISPEILAEEGLLSLSDINDIPSFPEDRVDYGEIIPFKYSLLQKAFDNFKNGNFKNISDDMEYFCRENKWWLDDFALFMALKKVHQSVWNSWDEGLVTRKSKAIKKVQKEHADLIQAQKFYQYLFFKQWKSLKEYANDRGIHIIGDIPIFVAFDSSDVWANPKLFHLDKNCRPTVVAGVPPDYFCETGQLWGNPLYRWDSMKKNDFKWWIERFSLNMVMLDIIRLDHFRGFEAFWEVPADEKTAINGKWVKAPGREFFRTIRNALGDVPIIAEDLGVITPEVEALRDECNYPGMKILQFAFGEGPENQYLPHNYPVNSVVYTGTHDNDTSAGWYHNSSTEHERDYVRRYLRCDGSEINWDMIHCIFESVSHTAIVPLQDLLGAGSEARMNYPGNPSGNWGWRYKKGDLNESISSRLSEITWLYGRKKE
jgi:4-alpha-glucanotransferase